MDEHDTLARLACDNAAFKECAEAFISTLAATWEHILPPTMLRAMPMGGQFQDDFGAGEATRANSNLIRWIRTQETDLGSLRDQVHHMRELLRALQDAS